MFEKMEIVLIRKLEFAMVRKIKNKRRILRRNNTEPTSKSSQTLYPSKFRMIQLCKKDMLMKNVRRHKR